MSLINKAVLGEGWRLLGSHEVIQQGDQTGCASLLMSLGHFEPWRDVDPEAVGETVAAWLVPDGDRKERVFRRRGLEPDAHSMVSEFHRAMGLPVASAPTVGTPEQRALRVRLMLEEVLEFAQAAGVSVCESSGEAAVLNVVADGTPNLTQMTHELADVQYVVSGTAVELGLPLREAVPVIHEANMRKLGPDGAPERDAGGKIRKPEGWTPADVSHLLK